MTEYRFTVVVLADDQVQASTVLHSRIAHDEDLTQYGVRDYVIWSENICTPVTEGAE